jgi:hypothetical protein
MAGESRHTRRDIKLHNLHTYFHGQYRAAAEKLGSVSTTRPNTRSPLWQISEALVVSLCYGPQSPPLLFTAQCFQSVSDTIADTIVALRSTSLSSYMLLKRSISDVSRMISDILYNLSDLQDLYDECVYSNYPAQSFSKCSAGPFFRSVKKFYKVSSEPGLLFVGLNTERGADNESSTQDR